MKVLVMYEDSTEQAYAETLTRVLNSNLGSMLCTRVEAMCTPFTDLPEPKVKPVVPKRTPTGVTIRKLDFMEE